MGLTSSKKIISKYIVQFKLRGTGRMNKSYRLAKISYELEAYNNWLWFRQKYNVSIWWQCAIRLQLALHYLWHGYWKHRRPNYDIARYRYRDIIEQRQVKESSMRRCNKSFELTDWHIATGYMPYSKAPLYSMFCLITATSFTVIRIMVNICFVMRALCASVMMRGKKKGVSMIYTRCSMCTYTYELWWLCWNWNKWKSEKIRTLIRPIKRLAD